MGRLREEDDRDRGAAGPLVRTAGLGGRAEPASMLDIVVRVDSSP
jgi:hypothetical protein